MWLLPSVVWALLSSILGSELSFQESSLLRSLGLSTRPSPKYPKPVPPVLWRIFQERKRLPSADKEPVDNCRVEEFNVPGNIIRVFSDQGPFLPKEQPQGWLCLRKLLLFNLSVRDEGERLTMAQLELKFHHNSYQPSSQGEVFELRLYQSAQGSPQGPPQPGQELLVGQSLAQLHKSLVLDVSAAAKKGWRSSRTLGWLLEISGATRGGCSGIDSFLDTSLLVVSLGGQCQAPGSSRRSRRSSGHPQVMPSNLCKPRRLFISFSDVGWEKWIIAPQGYLANYCRGECPFPLAAELNSTNHAVLQTMVHSQDPRGTPQPCCVPVRLSPISILYYDNSDNVVLRHYEDMVVDECGCR